jgi:hypothetical protein
MRNCAPVFDCNGSAMHAARFLQAFFLPPLKGEGNRRRQAVVEGFSATQAIAYYPSVSCADSSPFRGAKVERRL